MKGCLQTAGGIVFGLVVVIIAAMMIIPDAPPDQRACSQAEYFLEQWFETNVKIEAEMTDCKATAAGATSWTVSGRYETPIAYNVPFDAELYGPDERENWLVCRLVLMNDDEVFKIRTYPACSTSIDPRFRYPG